MNQSTVLEMHCKNASGMPWGEQQGEMCGEAMHAAQPCNKQALACSKTSSSMLQLQGVEQGCKSGEEATGVCMHAVKAHPQW